MDALVAQLPTIGAVIGTGIAVWRSMATRLDRIEGRMDRHLEWHGGETHGIKPGGTSGGIASV